MDDCTRDDKPAGWRGQLTVTVPITAFDFLDLGHRLSPTGQRVRGIVTRLLKEAAGFQTALQQQTAADRALIAGLEADGWHITTIRQTRR